ncbi:hypothetical protein HWV62_20212 [Athelia sp. TMB]|nr:hypothetical protein HWV62_20212 [Athelia sp. TMB]
MSAKSTDARIQDENAPLLATQSKSPSYNSDAPTIAVDRDVEAETADPDDTLLADMQKPEPQPWTPWSISVYAVLVTFVLFFVGIVIKGFVDEKDPKEPDFDLGKALKSALGGGLSGAAGSFPLVLTLMPMRTIMNYQYRYGTTTVTAAKTLYADGGFGRYYAGLLPALFQGPISRFGDTAANAGILALLQSNSIMKQLPAVIKTIFASVAAAAFRMTLTPIDTVKTTLQTQGKPGLKILRTRIKVYGVGTLWYGALATAAATFVGHYPWFAVYNWLSATLPFPETLPQKLARQAFIGFCASVTSDTISNSLRVVKTYRQVNATRIGYVQAARNVIAADGWLGLFGRGLGTRIIANGLQGIMFSILWKLFMDM